MWPQVGWMPDTGVVFGTNLMTVRVMRARSLHERTPVRNNYADEVMIVVGQYGQYEAYAVLRTTQI